MIKDLEEKNLQKLFSSFCLIVFFSLPFTDKKMRLIWHDAVFGYYYYYFQKHADADDDDDDGAKKLGATWSWFWQE